MSEVTHLVVDQPQDLQVSLDNSNDDKMKILIYCAIGGATNAGEADPAEIRRRRLAFLEKMQKDAAK